MTELQIPKVWPDLLRIEQMPEDTPKTYEDVPVTSARAYRDDRREVCCDTGRFKVFAILCSGDTNYWLQYEVWDGAILLYDSAGDPDYEVPEVFSLQSPELQVVVPIRLV